MKNDSIKISVKTRKFVFFVLLAGILVWLLCVVFHPFWRRLPEPQYEGKRLTEWALEIDQGDFFRMPAYQQHRQQDERAIAAIRHIGTNALPVVLELCRAKDSWFKRRLEEWSYRYNNYIYDNYPSEGRFTFHITWADDKHFAAINIVWALGSMTKPIIPDLIQLLQSRDPEIAENMMYALPGAGTNAIPPLIKLLNSPDKNVRLRAAIVLGDFFNPQMPANESGSALIVAGSEAFRSQARAAVPVLLHCIDSRDRNLTMRIRAIRALGLIREDASTVVPILVHHLQSETNDFLLPSDYISALGNFGTNAKPAVPILVHILESKPDGTHYLPPKAFVLVALWKIDPEADRPFVEKWKASQTNGLPTNALDWFQPPNPPQKRLQSSPNVQTDSASP
jgi:HEAT repeats